MLSPPSVLCAGREFHWWGWPPCSRCHHWIVQRTWSNRYPQRCSSSNLPLSNLCFLGACNVFAVARCSTMALIISSKKNQEQSVTSFLVWSLDKVSCKASCSWTSFPRLVLPSAASAPRSPPGIISHSLALHFQIAPNESSYSSTYNCDHVIPLPFPIQVQGFHHLFISEIYKLLP